MLCKTAAEMTRYKLGRIPQDARDEEDFRCGILTVWSMDAYMRNRRAGMDKETAGYNAWRRIDLMGLRHPEAKCSLVDSSKLPATYLPFLHEVTNQYRLAKYAACLTRTIRL